VPATCALIKKNFYAALLLRKENEKSKINACLCEISYIFYEVLSITIFRTVNILDLDTCIVHIAA
jgi:hypothetical protein